MTMLAKIVISVLTVIMMTQLMVIIAELKKQRRRCLQRHWSLPMPNGEAIAKELHKMQKAEEAHLERLMIAGQVASMSPGKVTALLRRTNTRCYALAWAASVSRSTNEQVAQALRQQDDA